MNKRNSEEVTVKLSPDTILNQEIIDELEELFTHVKPTGLRRSLIDLFFEFVSLEKDFSPDFPMDSLRIHMLVKFLDKVVEEENRRKYINGK